MGASIRGPGNPRYPRIRLSALLCHHELAECHVRHPIVHGYAFGAKNEKTPLSFKGLMLGVGKQNLLAQRQSATQATLPIE